MIKRDTTIHRFLFYFIISSVIIPIVLLGLISTLVSANTLRNELQKEDEIKVHLISKNIKDYIRGPLLEINILKESLEREFIDIQNINRLLSILSTNHEDIWSTQISDLSGEIKAIYPYNQKVIGTDISGHEYYKESIKTEKPYWSPTFLSDLNNSTAVTLSQKFNNGIITLFISIEKIGEIIQELNQENSKRVIVVTDQRSVYVYHPDHKKVLLRERDTNINNSNITYNNIEYFGYRVEMPDIGWHITLYTPKNNIFLPTFRMIIILLIIILIITTTSFIIGKKFGDIILSNIQNLLKSTNKISSGDYNIQISKLNIVELNSLGNSIFLMSKEIFNREHELKEANYKIINNKKHLEEEVEKQTRSLRQTLEQLEATKTHMIESEKMASLGGMVAGIAHEINTPIGIIVTASSYLNDKTEEILESFSNNAMSKSMFENYCDVVVETTSLILSNSRRSSNLISSFKQVAVDQSSEEIRKFNLYNYINEVLTSLQPNLKKHNHRVAVSCPQDLQMNSYPGAVAQILTNLIINSISHGFEDKMQGVITINIIQNENMINFTYSDNGIGMSRSELKQIYDPFYTTKRGKGGSGLGMNIVYNIITQKLKGTIKCHSSKGDGVTFVLNFPLDMI